MGKKHNFMNQDPHCECVKPRNQGRTLSFTDNGIDCDHNPIIPSQGKIAADSIQVL